MVYEGFLYALKEEGIEEIEALNQPFDPNKHHAVQAIPAEEGQESDVVVQVFQKGYMLKDRVLRPAMVIVSQHVAFLKYLNNNITFLSFFSWIA